MALVTRSKRRRCACAAAAAAKEAARGWATIPDDLLDAIAAFLSPASCRALALTCTAWSKLVQRPRECDVQPGRGAGSCPGGALPLLSAGRTALRTLSLAGSELHLPCDSFLLDTPCLASLDLSNALAVCAARGRRVRAQLAWAGGTAPASLASLQLAASFKRAAAFAPVPSAALAGQAYARLTSLVASSPMLPHDCRSLRGLTRLDVCEPWFCGFDVSAMFPASLRALCMRTWPNEEGAEVLDALAAAAEGGMRLEELEWSGIGCRTNFYMHFEPEALGSQQSLRSLIITVPVCPGCLFWSLRQLPSLEHLEFRQPTICYEEEMASASRSLWLPSLTTLILRIYFTCQRAPEKEERQGQEPVDASTLAARSMQRAVNARTPFADA
ncbi:hypothetical protein WJX81_006240 [Elliptochloris bilobata]|uniref:F-box domain-containing protein n=1 Tax=Elliptochloris bilobata TaxID=381761 RepID=A0AAW1SDC6_9CHLO